MQLQVLKYLMKSWLGAKEMRRRYCIHVRPSSCWNAREARTLGLSLAYMNLTIEYFYAEGCVRIKAYTMFIFHFCYNCDQSVGNLSSVTELRGPRNEGLRVCEPSSMPRGSESTRRLPLSYCGLWRGLGCAVRPRSRRFRVGEVSIEQRPQRRCR